MNNQGAIQCKVKLLADGEQQEMRRFQLDDAAFASNFDFFKEKLRAVFPQLRDTAFKVTWTDSDGDVITIGNDEDLLMSMMEMDGLKVLDVHIGTEVEAKDDVEEEPIFNPLGSMMITCDVCNNRITRYRYKCLQCHDYDLCLACEQAGNHAHHVMMRLANLEIPRALPKMLGHWSRSARKAAHHAAKEAHRCARGSVRAAHAAAASAASAGGAAKCPFRQGPQGPRASSASEARQETPMGLLDTTALYDLAASFLGPFVQATAPAQAQSQAQSQAQAPPQAQPQAGTPNQASGAATGTATPTANANPAPGTPGDVIGNILRDVFSAINANVAQAHGQATAATPTPTPTPTSTPAADVILVDPIPKAKETNIPMEVESVTAPIYPNVPQAPDAGWTFIPPALIAQAAQAAQPTAPIAPVVAPVAPVAAPLNPDEVKYASQLGQLRRMGFSESIDLLSLLKRYNGNIGMVVNHLFEHGN